MYLYQPCLLSLALCAWAFDRASGKKRWLRVLWPLGMLAVSELDVSMGCVVVYPAALLLPCMYLMGRLRSVVCAEVTTGALLGGLLSWKAADAWPLLPGLPLLCSFLLLIPIVLLCRVREDRFLACTMGCLIYELFFCLREFMLFSFCVVRFGSRGGLDLGAATLCLYVLLAEGASMVLPRLKRTFSIGI